MFFNTENKSKKKPYTYKFKFSDVHNCENCEAVFNNRDLLQDHNKNAHKKSSNDIQETEIEYTQANSPKTTIKQVHCALETPGVAECQFQCQTDEELDTHIKR